jgi:hypothetical protein
MNRPYADKRANARLRRAGHVARRQRSLRYEPDTPGLSRYARHLRCAARGFSARRSLDTARAARGFEKARGRDRPQRRAAGGGDLGRLRQPLTSRDKARRGLPGAIGHSAHTAPSRALDAAKAGHGGLRADARQRPHPLPAGRRGRNHQPVELSVQPRHRPAGRRACRRQPRDAEAVGTDAAHIGFPGGIAGRPVLRPSRSPPSSAGRKPARPLRASRSTICSIPARRRSDGWSCKRRRTI